MRLRGVVVVVAAGLLWLASALATLAASPSPEPAVGDPGFALLAVVAIGAGTVAATLIYVRLTARNDV